jgi:hypothetical protein
LIEENVALTIKMDEIADGLPTFYLILGIGLVVTVTGSLGIARYVRYLRIPGFIKKINTTTKAIKKNKTIADERLTKTREEEMVEKFGDYWKMIDLELDEILGIKEQESKTPAVTPSDAETGGI